MSETTNRSDLAEALVHEYIRSRRADLREKIISEFSDTVERVARKYSGFEAQEDLVQVGYIGLLNALSLFEPAKGVRFNTYATHLIAGSIKHHLRDKTKIIREPAWLQEVRHKVNRTAAQLHQELARTPTAEEIATKAEITSETVREVLSTDELFKVTSIHTPSNSEEDDDEIEMSDDCRDMDHFEERMVLQRAIGELRELEQKVLSLFHFHSLNQTEIATQLGISGNYVSHILRQSLSKLRTILAKEERHERVLHRQASAFKSDVIDDATGAYTETYFWARLEEECSRAACEGTEVGLVRVEFNGLDQLRNFYGPDTFENFLADAAAFLADSVRRLDIVGREGESGFAIILPSAGQSVTVVRDRIASRLATWMHRWSAGVTVKIGEAYYPKCGRNARRLKEKAVLGKLDESKAA